MLWIKRRKIISTKRGLSLGVKTMISFFLIKRFLTQFCTDSDEEDSASASNTQKEKPASNTEKDQAEPHLSNGVDASPSSSSSRYISSTM